MADVKTQNIDDDHQRGPQLQAEKARQHARDYGLLEHAELLVGGSLLSHYGMDAAAATDAERKVLIEETTHRFKQR